MRYLEATITPYLEIGGIETAALVSHEGLLVATAGSDALNMEAVAAGVATSLTAAEELASQPDSDRARTFTLEHAGRGLLIAPVTDDILLVLVGQNHVIRSLADGSRA